MSVLAGRLLAVHDALSNAEVPHAFGGAIALAYCTSEPRGTRDLDINVFVQASEARAVLEQLPEGVEVSDSDVGAAVEHGQVRVWWDETPLDVFFDVHEFHRNAAAGVRFVPFEDTEIPVLGCSTLAIFKVMFNRTKDWADIEAMLEVGGLGSEELLGWVVRLVGGTDARTARLAGLVGAAAEREAEPRP